MTRAVAVCACKRKRIGCAGGYHPNNAVADTPGLIVINEQTVRIYSQQELLVVNKVGAKLTNEQPDRWP
jgi:hypothetical protein